MISMCLLLVSLAPMLGLAELVLPAPLVSLSSDQGEKLLMGATYKADFFQLGEHFTTQINGAFCGPASACAVLNALGVPRPPQAIDSMLSSASYNYYDQANVFTNDTELIVPKASVLQEGMSLEQLAGFLAAQPGVAASFQHSHVASLQVGKFRDSILSALSQPDEFVICNFDRSALNERGGGHHSPLAAYNKESDMVLVLDVSRYKYPAWWVPVTALYTATIGSTDPKEDDPRGLVFVWKSADGPTPRVGAGYITPNRDDDGGIYIMSSAMLSAAANGSAAGRGGGLSGGALFGAIFVSLAAGMAVGAVVAYAVAMKKGWWHRGSGNGGGTGETKAPRSDGSCDEESPLFSSSSVSAISTKRASSAV